MKGESLYKISVRMGNSPEICRRHYAAPPPETMADSVDVGRDVSPMHGSRLVLNRETQQRPV
jgi:hypothetical protein